MPACEKCWGDAYLRERCEPMKSQAEHYQDLLEERKDNPCTEKGQFYKDSQDPTKKGDNPVGSVG